MYSKSLQHFEINAKVLISIIIFVFAGFSDIYSQDLTDSSSSSSLLKNKYFKVRGSANLNSEFTSISDKSVDSSRKTLSPNNGMRGNLFLNINLFEQIDLPFEVWFSTKEIGYQQPFNQFGVNPRIGNWLTLHAGYFYNKLSDLSFGDARVYGAGIDLSPGDFKFSFLYGRIRDKRNADTNNSFGGEYKRFAYAFKLGYGNEDGVYAAFNLMKAWDDTSRKLNSYYSPLPNANLVSSLDFGLPITDYVKLNVEAAVSAFTDDMYASDYKNSDIPGFVNDLFDVTYSSKVDAAIKAGLYVSMHRNFNFRINSLWVGPGFNSLGYPNMPNDVFDVTFAPNFRFLNGDLSIRSSIGMRQNNLRNNLLSTTKRLIGSIDIYSQLTNQISLNAQYTNYGMKTKINRDTLHLQNISQSFTLTPSYEFEWLDGLNSLSASYSYQDVEDKNSFDTNTVLTQSHFFNINHNIIFESSLNINSSMFYSDNSTDIETKIYGISETASYQFFDKILTVSTTLGITLINSIRDDQQILARFSAVYSLDKYGAFTLNLTNMNYSAGSSVNDVNQVPSYNELQGSLQYSISF